MITAISSVKQNSNLSNNVNLKRTNQVTFTGSQIILLKNEGKISRFADEAVSSIGRGFRKLFGNGELPFSKKTLTANATLTHIIGDGQGIVDVPVPEVHTTVAKILDGANILKPDAADLAANALDAASTKAALAGALSDTASTFDALASGTDVANAATNVVDGITTAVQHKSIATDVIHGIAEVLDKIF